MSINVVGVVLALVLILDFGVARAELDMEMLDKIYFNCVNVEAVGNGSATHVNQNPEDLDTPSAEYRFEAAKGATIKIYPKLVDKIDQTLQLSKTKLATTDGTTKISLRPFKTIDLESEEGVLNIGKYYKTYELNGTVIQRYINGDKCDLCKDKRWEAVVFYTNEDCDLRLSGPFESSTCVYRFGVEGRELGSECTYRKLLWSRKLLPKTPEKNRTDESPLGKAALSKKRVLHEYLSYPQSGVFDKLAVR